MRKTVIAFTSGFVIAGAVLGAAMLIRVITHPGNGPDGSSAIQRQNGNRPAREADTSLQPARSEQVHDPVDTRAGEGRELLQLLNEKSELRTELQRIEVENKKLQADVDRLQQKYQDLLNWIAGRPSPQSQNLTPQGFGEVDEPDQNVIQDDLQLTPRLLQFLGVTEQEHQQLAALFARHEKLIEANGMKNAVVEESSQDHVLIRIPAAAGEEKNMEQEIADEVEAILGPTRSEAFMTLAASKVRQLMHYFGACGRTLEFSVVGGTGGQAAECHVTDTHEVTPGQYSTGNEITTNSLPAEYSAFRQFLPVGIRRFCGN